MTDSELVKRILAGERLFVVEYRNTIAEIIRWRDPETGRMNEAPICRHEVESQGQQVAVSERLPDGANVADVKHPFARGTICVLKVAGLERVKGAFRASGALEALEKSAGASRATA